jgi:surfeit locus 1 family protein
VRRFRPTFWATLFTVPALAVLVALGIWQLQRLAWKDALIAERQARSAAPAMTLPAEIDDPEALAFTRVRVRGSFLHEAEMYLVARPLAGRPGLHVVTPLVLEDGRALLVDRGWVPEARKDPATRAEGQLAGVVELEGLLRIGGWTGYSWLKPENQPAENVWYRVEPAAMAEAADLARAVTAVYLDAGPAENPGGLPKGGQTRVHMANDHLGYAITWFALAVALVAVYLIYHLRGPSGRPEEPS